MKKNSIILIFALILLTFILSACDTEKNSDNGTSQGRELEESSEENLSGNGEFRVGLEAMYPPFNWTQLDDSNGAVKISGSNEYAGGYDVEIAKRVAEKLGKKLVVVKIEWDGLVPALQTNVIDAIMAGMSPTEDRKKAIDFSENYYRSSYVLVVKKGSKFENSKSIQDFKSAKVTGQLNTLHYDAIDQIEGVDKQMAAVDFPTMRVALEAGTIDAYVTEMPEAVSSVSANSNFVIVNPEEGFKLEVSDTDISVGLRKNDENIVKINEALSEISDDERNEIMKKSIENQPASNSN